MRKLIVIITTLLVAQFAYCQDIIFVKDEIMTHYMKSKKANKLFVPKGKYDKEKSRQGKWKDYKTKSDFTYVIKNNKPTAISGKYLVYGEGKFKDDKRIGDWSLYLIEDKTYKKILYKKATYNNGALEGVATYFLPSGEIVAEVNYKSNKFEGLFETFYPNGGKYFVGYFEASKETGTHQYFYKNGTVKYSKNFKKGVANGKYEAFYEDGTLKEIFDYKEGEVDGKYQFYHPNSQLWIEKIYKEGLLMNVTGSYSASGEKRDVGTLKDGNGTVNFYDKQGEIYTVHTLKNGEVIKKEDVKELKSKF